MKGIVLAGGSGTRLQPATKALSKQLLPVYDKPMVYYPLSVLLLAGIRDVLLISTPHDLPLFERLLGDGSDFGIQLSYSAQAEPRGLAEAFLIGRRFLAGDPACLVLGDNIFHGHKLSTTLQNEVGALAGGAAHGCTLFGYTVADPQRYGVAEVDGQGRILSIEEKPAEPRSRLAVTGVYMYDGTVSDRAATLRPSHRNELEITDLNLTYVAEGRARLVEFGRGMAWLDTGTHDSLLEASTYVQVLEHRQGVRIACLEEIALRMGYIDPHSCYALGAALAKSGYGEYVMDIARAAGATG